MNARIRAILAVGLILVLTRAAASEPAAKPVPRKDAFFGMHFDLHTSTSDKALGADITEENLAALLDRVRPDYVQYDCKGHPGYTGYPTKIGWASPGIVQDSLALWRQATRARGIGLYIHYSGVLDKVAIEHHPEWARLGPDGKPDPDNTSTFGPYVDQLMIPQLIEAATAYDLDGAWVDGDCWGAKLDYSPAAMEAWKQETGYTEAPKNRHDPHWLEWKMLHRRQFEKYLCHWIDAVHAARPGIQLTSNWMYTTLAPKPVVAQLDFLSGDYSPTMSVDQARVEARYLASTGMPWDLMAWGFNNAPKLQHSLKPAVQLEQEAAVVLMAGGGFQVYYQPTRAGYIIPEIVDVMGPVADFCRARQKVSHKSTTVPQVALVLSTETQMDRSDEVFFAGDCLDELKGMLHALLESHYSVDVLAEHQLQPRLAEFPLVVVPNSYKLTEEFRQALRHYVEEGGRLLLAGPQAARLFEADLGVQLVGDLQSIPSELATAAGVVNQDGDWQPVTLTTAQPLGFRHPTRDTRRDGAAAASCATLGQGQIAAIYGPLAMNYWRSHHPWLRRFLSDIVAQLFPEPAVRVEGPPCVDVALRRTADGLLSVHLLNTAGMPVGVNRTITDFIPPVGPVQLRLKAEKPQQVVWAPDETPLEWSWDQGTLAVTVPRVEIHGVVVVKP